MSLSQETRGEIVSSDVTVALGQSLELSLPAIKKFSVNNKDVIAYHYNEKKQKMLLRGKRLGHSELLVWTENEDIISFQIFVLTKKQELKLAHIGVRAQKLGLSTQMNLSQVRIWGELKSIEHYQEYKRLKMLNRETIIDEVKLTLSLRDQIIADIYVQFFNDYKESIRCQSQLTLITCEYSSNEPPSPSLKSYLSEKYHIEWIEKNHQKIKKNYLVKMKILQIEQLSGEEFHLGLEELSGNLGEFLYLPLEKIIARNQVLLSKKKLKLSSLAQPQYLMRPLVPAVMQIGADIPYSSSTKENQATTLWQFAGLKILLKLENMGQSLKLDYQTELTQHHAQAGQNSSIVGNKEKSSVIIELDRPTKIFELSLKSEGQNTDQMPLLGSLPLIGEIFKSKSKQSTFKTITAIIRIEEHD